MKRVVIESPYKGDGWTYIRRNVRYLRACMRDCLLRGEAPFASHGLYTQPGVLCDRKPDERKLGIEMGFGWRSAADLTVVYYDFGVSEGMRQGIQHSHDVGVPVEYRSLPGWLPRNQKLRRFFASIRTALRNFLKDL
jgi:hypothetical protein